MPISIALRFCATGLPTPIHRQPASAGRLFASAGMVLALAASFSAAAQERHHRPDGDRGGFGGRPEGGHDRGSHVERATQQRPSDRPQGDGSGVRGRADFGAPHMRFDNRFHDGHYYPARGFVSPALPPGALHIGYRGGRYYYQGGVWFRPYGSRFTVIAPPFGIVLPLLPLSYATLWFGGSPYYYANNVYYAPVGGGYQVVAPPPGAQAAQIDPDDPAYRQPPDSTAAQPAAAPALPNPIVYPRNGQPPEQTEADLQQCNSWAASQPGAVADADVFQRATAACMDARGYTLR